MMFTIKNSIFIVGLKFKNYIVIYKLENLYLILYKSWKAYIYATKIVLEQNEIIIMIITIE